MPDPAAPPAVPDDRAVADFGRMWEVYSKAVDHDYFSHRAVAAELHRVLADEVGRPFRFLDLACGDARTAVAALPGTPVARYHGVDLSEPALAAARAAVAALPCPAELERADFVAAVRDLPAGAADVVWIGLSLHHLQTPAKADLMRAVRAVVGGDGRFLIYEPVCREGEGRPAFLDRFEATYRPLFAAMTADEWAAIMAHVRACDLPESPSGWAGLGRAAGFSEVRELFTDPPGMITLFGLRP
ncbi:MAG: class I SAM-dependent methyltransferase [Gemmataceae bacterium]|nr:class I SAM-dependent methyltransferase [Gemmataceae bacterium]